MNEVLIDYELVEWVLAGVAALGVIAGAWLEFRRERESVTHLRNVINEHREYVMELDVRLRVLEHRVSSVEEKGAPAEPEEKPPEL
jgi:uncharacterized coiled-coil protein SlyX